MSIEKCYYCNEIIPRELRTIEHKIPLSRGGIHSHWNVVMACLSCNCSKREKTEEEYRLYLLRKKLLLCPKIEFQRVLPSEVLTHLEKELQLGFLLTLG